MWGVESTRSEISFYPTLMQPWDFKGIEKKMGQGGGKSDRGVIMRNLSVSVAVSRSIIVSPCCQCSRCPEVRYIGGIESYSAVSI